MFLDAILQLVRSREFGGRPGWRGKPSIQRKSRTPFGGGRKRGPGECRMQTEEFSDKEARNARFRELRDGGTPHVSKFSTVRGNKSVWCVVRPR